MGRLPAKRRSVRGGIPRRTIRQARSLAPGNHDLLCLTKPDVVTRIHEEYLAAGADIASTNTFTATSISQADYGTQAVVRELNATAAQLARRVCDRFERKDGRPRSVAGALGPTNRTLSLSPDVN